MDRKCSFCDQKQSNYVCPKCGQYYCSVNCYKHLDHLKCSEEFYKDWVMNELSSKSFNSESKKKTLEMLKRVNLNDDLDVNLNKINEIENNDANLKSYLTLEELETFNKMLKTGSIFNLLPSSFWDPWYFRYKKKLVEIVSEKDEIRDKSDISKYGSKLENKLENKILPNNINSKTAQLKNDNSESDYDLDSGEDDIPEIREIPLLNELISKNVSPSVTCSIINTIFCYCYICRRFTGDHLLTPTKSYKLLMRISLLPKHKSYDTTEEAIQFSCRKLIEEQACPLRLIEQLLIDTSYIIKNYNDLVFRILSDLIKLCSKKMTREMKEKKLIKKKLEFFLSWSKACGNKLILELKKIELELFSIREQCTEPKNDILFNKEKRIT